jgi:hypothetical protein
VRRCDVERCQFSPEELLDRGLTNTIHYFVQCVIRPLVVIENHLVSVDDARSWPVRCLRVVGIQGDFVEFESWLDGLERLRDDVKKAFKVGLACSIITAVDLLGIVAPEVSRVESAAVILEVNLSPWDVEKPGSLEKCLELIRGLWKSILKRLCLRVQQHTLPIYQPTILLWSLPKFRIKICARRRWDHLDKCLPVHVDLRSKLNNLTRSPVDVFSCDLCSTAACTPPKVVILGW